MAEVKIVITNLAVTPSLDAFMVLREEDGKRFMAVQLSVQDLKFVSNALMGQDMPATTPHAAMKEIIAALEGTIEKTVITELNHGAYVAQIHLKKNGCPVTTTARPSDAIALALLAKCPIWVKTEVLEETVRRSKHAKTEAELAWFQNLDPDSLIKI